MYLLEHDAKELLARHHVRVPAGKLLADAAEAANIAADLPPGPWIVKGQISAGGRGKAGIIKKAATPQELAEHTTAILGRAVKGRTVESVRVEQQVAGASEAYLSLMVDAAAGAVRVHSVRSDAVRDQSAVRQSRQLVGRGRCQIRHRRWRAGAAG